MQSSLIITLQSNFCRITGSWETGKCLGNPQLTTVFTICLNFSSARLRYRYYASITVSQERVGERAIPRWDVSSHEWGKPIRLFVLLLTSSTYNKQQQISTKFHKSLGEARILDYTSDQTLTRTQIHSPTWIEQENVDNSLPDKSWTSLNPPP